MKAIRAEAKKTLYSRSNQTRLVLLGIITTFGIMIPVLTLSYAASLIDILLYEYEYGTLIATVASSALAVISAVLVTFPLISDAYQCAFDCFNGSRVRYAGCFGKDYKRHIGAGALLSVRWLPAVALLLLSASLPSFIAGRLADANAQALNEATKAIDGLIDLHWLVEILLSWAFMLLFITAALAVSFIIFFCFGSLFMFPYFVSRGKSLSESVRMSKRIMKQSKGANRRFLSSFTGLMILSVLSLGILFIFYCLPLMLVSYFEAAGRLENGEQIQK